MLSSFKVNRHRPSVSDVIRVTEGHDNLGVVAGISFLNYKERDLRELSDYLKDGIVKGLQGWALFGFTHRLFTFTSIKMAITGV